MRRVTKKIKTEPKPWGQFNNDPQIEKTGETAHDDANPQASAKTARNDEKTT